MKSIAFTAAIAAMSLTACVPYPIYKTLQPAAQVTVLDEADHPLPQAEVTLIASAYPYGFEKTRETKNSASDGIANFASAREWRAESMMIHGAEAYFWNWCIRKDGYVTFLTDTRDGDKFTSKLIVHMKRGQSTACPAGAKLHS